MRKGYFRKKEQRLLPGGSLGHDGKRAFLDKEGEPGQRPLEHQVRNCALLSEQKGCCDDNEGAGEGVDRAGCVQAQEPGWRCPCRRQGRAGRFSELSLETWGPVGFRIHNYVTRRPQPEPLETSIFPRVSHVALVVKNPPANAGDIRDAGSIPGSGRFPGEGNGDPLQYSCLENSMDRGAWQATVPGVEQSWTRLKRLSTCPRVSCSHSPRQCLACPPSARMTSSIPC